MARGGRRQGAGRKHGSVTKRTREIAEKAAAEGITPLEVMLGAMRHHWAAERYDVAAGFAKDAAPYMHPRLASHQHAGPRGGPIPIVDLTRATDDQLDAIEAIFGPLAAAGGDDGGDPGGEGEAGG